MNEAPRFLLVEDDALTARTTRRAIEWCLPSAQVDVCGDVGAAKRAMKERPYDVIISDFELPDGSGADVLACASVVRPDSPRILVTGHTEWETATRALNEGNAFRIVAKPWEPAEMRSLLDEALALKRSRTSDQNGRVTADMARASVSDWLRGQRDALERELVRRTEGLGEALLVALGRRAPGTERRARQTALLAGWIAAGVGLEGEAVDDVRLAGLFHEIGALSFTDEEWRLPETARRARAAKLGASMLGAIPALRGVRRIVSEQTARFDGGDDGEGASPRGSEISIGGRILAACALFQSTLVGRDVDATAFATACDAVAAEGGRSLDPAIVGLLVVQPLASIRQLLHREVSR
jgi:response regulator RpfG family c-di-GMP phosphodiesterase